MSLERCTEANAPRPVRRGQRQSARVRGTASAVPRWLTSGREEYAGRAERVPPRGAAMFMTSRPAVALLLVALSGIALAADAPAPPALVSTADHKAQSPEIAIGPDDSINMIWIDEDTAPKQHDRRRWSWCSLAWKPSLRKG